MKLRNNAVIFSPHFKPLPAGYQVLDLGNGLYQWVNDEKDQAGPIHPDKWWIRRCAFAHGNREAFPTMVEDEKEVLDG